MEAKDEIRNAAIEACGELVELLLADATYVDFIANCYSPASFPRSREREAYSIAIMLWHGYGELPELGRWLQACRTNEQHNLLSTLLDRSYQKRLFRLLSEQRDSGNRVPQYLADLAKATNAAIDRWKEWQEWERLLDGNLT